jgi:hypothetical protein
MREYEKNCSSNKWADAVQDIDVLQEKTGMKNERNKS